ncbi:class I SAM-dependent methyltransferase [Noviherbaspirillum saxi]|uniref:Methyltransferase n=1 Tax=Noviherbaspirillum saxi TaxID=2320863 RepID=A0A3A3FXT7_9BURK|nr:class I SAM-dependent methyltransferase [Noviherbaspirillum saxi]RJF99488.1 methyltransferase [Noviherbaspirillum saxi]
MTDWTSGYVADIGYTFGYYHELNPLRLRLAFLNAGVTPPETNVACELGFGQGMSINLHAAASVTQWYGTDFNPSQAAFAQELALVSNAGAQIFDEGFAEFCNRKDLPEFDYIGLHGIWSWISDENRSIIVDFFRRKLKVGGVLYLSYNTQPGWASMVPMRHLLTEHAEVMAAPGRGIISRVDAAMEFAEKLLATNPLYLRANPQVAQRIKSMKAQDRSYLAHEYFNRDWHPMPFAEMAEWLAPAKLNFACSGHYLSHVNGVNLTGDQQAFLNDIPDPMFRETVRDFMVNQQFRRDYWVRGLRRLSNVERIEAIRRQKVILILARTALSLTAVGALGEAKMHDNIYSPILDVLTDHRVHTIGHIEQAVAKDCLKLAHILEALMLLIDKGAVAAVQEDQVIENAKLQTDRLNLHLMNKCKGSSDISYLASPVTGGGVGVARSEQLFLLAALNGRKQPSEWAQFVWEIFAAQGQSIVVDGKALPTAEANIAKLTKDATAFALQQLPILKSLQIA